MDTKDNAWLYIGYTGCIFLFFSFIPQTYKVIRNEQTNQISPLFVILIMISSTLLGYYAFIINSYPILLSNLSVFINNFVILMYYFYKKLFI